MDEENKEEFIFKVNTNITSNYSDFLFGYVEDDYDKRWVKNDKNAIDLYNAWKSRDKDKVRSLVENDVDINLVNYKGETILHQACWYGDVGFIELLIELGADINCRDIQNNTPVNKAAFNHHFKAIEYLIKKGCDISVVADNGWDIWRNLTDDPVFDKIREKNNLLVIKNKFKSI
jgi:ankyrin repeat protein